MNRHYPCDAMVTVDEIRAVASALPRTNEGLVRGQVKFRVGRIVYLSISRDGSTMGFAFPKDWRNALVESEPEKFSLPSEHDMRYHWVDVRLDSIAAEQKRESAPRARPRGHRPPPGSPNIRRERAPRAPRSHRAPRPGEDRNQLLAERLCGRRAHARAMARSTRGVGGDPSRRP